MKVIPPLLADRLAGETATLCHAWILTRHDGVRLGFTDHDRDLVVAGTLCQAATGLAASDIESATGLSVDQAEVSGALSSAAIRAEDVRAGLYDGASVVQHLVDWQMPGLSVEILSADLGEVTMEGAAFRAELRSPVHRLEQPRGRVYSHRCDAVLGDARCRVDLSEPGRTGIGEIVAVVSPTRLVVAGLAGFARGLFRNGLLTITSGVAAGQSFDIADEAEAEDGRDIRLWLPMKALPAAGDAVRLTIGCNKTFAQCRNRFSNALNFQGFPHMPGADFAYAPADGDGEHDGAPIHD